MNTDTRHTPTSTHSGCEAERTRQTNTNVLVVFVMDPLFKTPFGILWRFLQTGVHLFLGSDSYSRVCFFCFFALCVWILADMECFTPTAS